MSEHLVPLTEIESEAHWGLGASGIELKGEVRCDWAGRPSVPAETAARLYAELVELRDTEARRRMAAAEAQIRAIERARPVRGGIPALPGSNAPAIDVMMSFDRDREQR